VTGSGAATVYLAERLKHALSNDRRVGELDVTVTIDGRTVQLAGTVTTPERRAAAEALVRRVLPDMTVCNDLSVTTTNPTAPEQLG
jgi:osmotically-inducible protein OsmY